MPSVLVAPELFRIQSVSAYRIDLHLIKMASVFPSMWLPVHGNVISFSQALLI